MASTSKTYSENFDNNNSFEVDTLSAYLSSVKTKADADSIPNSLRQFSSIYEHTCIATKEEKAYTKKRYFCRYCSP